MANPVRRTHGQSYVGGKETRTYQAWNSMRKRCRPNSAQKTYYADRGISVCARWDSFTLFLKDMGECPEGMTLDRIDNDLGYGPDNCRWASQAEQSRNKRTNHMIEFNGKRQCISDWERDLGLGVGTLVRRIARGVPLERALLPIDPTRKRAP